VVGAKNQEQFLKLREGQLDKEEHSSEVKFRSILTHKIRKIPATTDGETYKLATVRPIKY